MVIKLSLPTDGVVDESTNNLFTYTLQGIRLNTPPTTKGIYIANGRKHLK